MPPQKMKYLGMNLTKSIYYLYVENHNSDEKKSKICINGYTVHVYG